MLELELNNASAMLVDFDPKLDKDKNQISELTISVGLDADILAHFEPTLKSMIFDHGAPRDLAEGMPLRDKHMVWPMKRDEEMNGASVIIDYGLKEKIHLGACQLKDFRLTPREGGAVIVEFTVRCRPDPHKHVPYLYLHQGAGITITLIPADPADLPKMAEAA